MDIEKIILEFFQEKLPNVSLGKSDNIFELGLVDSLFALQIVSFVEDQFEIECEDNDLELENFCSIGNLERFIKNKISRMTV